MKTIFAIFFSLGTFGTCLGQGVVNWAISPFVNVIVQTNESQFYGGGPQIFGPVGNTASASSGLVYYFELLYNTNFAGSQVPTPDYTTLFGGTWLDTGLIATNGNNAGRIVMMNPNNYAVVPWDRGTTNHIMLVGWSANLGTSWLQVSNELANWNAGYSGIISGAAFFGESATGYITPNDSPALGAVLFNSEPTANGLPIYNPSSSPMQLYILTDSIPGPEPSTLALAGLGALTLLLLRRRK
jgi:hypothetical protein